MGRLNDLTGQRFGRLTVIERAENKKDGRAKWLCQCDCGKTTVTTGTNLRTGVTKSCGCYMIECETARIKEICTTHGKSHTRLYKTWRNMKQRCYNPNNTYYHRYGGRGITVCADWKQNFKAFYDWAMTSGYQDDLSIDRINNDKGYSPDNCRWATRKVQERNKSRNRLVELNGKTKTLAEWCEIYAVDYDKARSCLRYGGSPEEALGLVPRKK